MRTAVPATSAQGRRAPRRAPVGQASTWYSGAFSALNGVRWSLAYAALLFYIVIITTYAFGFGSVVMAIALVALVLEPRLRINGVLLLFGALVVWGVATHFRSPWPDTSMASLQNLAKIWLIALVAVATLTDRRRVRLFMLVFVAAYALYPVRGTLINYFLSGYSVFGRALWNYIYSNPNDLAALTLLQISIVAAIFVAEPRGLYRTGAIAALIVLPMIVLLTQSRGAFLGLMVFAALAFTAQRRKARLIVFTGLLLVISLLILPQSAWERFGMLGVIGSGGAEALGELDDQGSAEQRYAIWETAREIIADNPTTGIGWGNYALANGAYAPDLGMRDAHSTYYNVLAEVGITGFLLFAGLIGAVLLRAQRTRRRLKTRDPVLAQQIRYLELGLIGFLAAAIFASYGKLTFLYLHLVLIWVHCDLAVPTSPVRPLRSANRYDTA